MPSAQHMLIGIGLVFAFAFGACVGSFLNVIIYRLPAGLSVITPPSRCPTCGARLGWRENLPILGWLLLRGRCKHCEIRISPQYMVIETFVAVLFVLFAVLFYVVPPTTPGWGVIGGAWWHDNNFLLTWAAFVALLLMVSGLVAMTMIDAKTFTIPIQIPLVITILAFILMPLQALLPARGYPVQLQPFAIPTTCWKWFAIACGGMIGIGVAMLLLQAGKLRLSFADYDEYVQEGETLGDYPHARREMLVELKFLLPCMAGLVAGFFIGNALPTTPPPLFIQAIGGTLFGYLVGGGLIWAIRILGTLGFGREAMGLGDVHLLAAVGAVMGWQDPIWIFFIAPFSGLVWVLVSIVMASVFKRPRRELPYGPHLAIATLVVILARPGINALWRNSLMLQQPPPGNQQPLPPRLRNAIGP